MRLYLNLATHPYRDMRQFLMTWGVGALVLALLTVALSGYASYSWLQSRSMRQQISEVRGQIDKFDRERAAGMALLNQPQNREIASQASFLNGLIARRSFSLTRLFMELEHIMPARLHVLSITPSLNKQNQIEIHMLVGGDSREQALALVEKLEDSPSFRQPELRAESFGALTGGDRVQFDIASIYVPPAGVAEKTSEEKPDKKEAQAKEQAPGKGKQKAQAVPAGAKPKSAGIVRAAQPGSKAAERGSR